MHLPGIDVYMVSLWITHREFIMGDTGKNIESNCIKHFSAIEYHAWKKLLLLAAGDGWNLKYCPFDLYAAAPIKILYDYNLWIMHIYIYFSYATK